jgi:hypothetical protein
MMAPVDSAGLLLAEDEGEAVGEEAVMEPAATPYVV